MADLRRIAALSLTALAFAAAGCGDDGDDEPEGGQSDAPVNTDTPAQNPGTTPAPESGGQNEGP